MKTKIYRPLPKVVIILTPDARGKLCIGITVLGHTTILVEPVWLRILKSHWQYKWRYSPFPIYWERYSRDCDQFAVEWVERHPNGAAAYRSYCDALDGAEGPERFFRISKREWEQNKNWRHERDHAAEQAGY